MDFITQNIQLIISLIFGALGLIAGLYGAIQSWFTKKRTKQLELEYLLAKLDIDFDYNLVNLNNRKIIKGKVIFKNLGNTNLRITELEINGENRNTKFAKTYQGENKLDLDTNFQIKNFLGVSNIHVVKFGDKDNNFFIKITDDIFVQREGKRRILSVKENVNTYINSNIESLKDKLQSNDLENFENLLFKNMLGKDLRGLEIFPGGEKTQEFVLEYTGSGLYYLNVETTALRMFKSDIFAIEEIKKIGVEFMNNKEITTSNEGVFAKKLQKILTPASDEFLKEKETFLILFE